MRYVNMWHLISRFSQAFSWSWIFPSVVNLPPVDFFLLFFFLFVCVMKSPYWCIFLFGISFFRILCPVNHLLFTWWIQVKHLLSRHEPVHPIVLCICSGFTSFCYCRIKIMQELWFKCIVYLYFYIFCAIRFPCNFWHLICCLECYVTVL